MSWCSLPTKLSFYLSDPSKANIRKLFFNLWGDNYNYLIKAKMKGFLHIPIGNTQIIFNQIFSVSISSLYFVFFFSLSLSLFSIEIGGDKKGEIPDLFNVAILLKSSQIKAIYYIRLFYKCLRWGTHLFTSLFPSVCPSACCAPYLRNWTLSNHNFW